MDLVNFLACLPIFGDLTPIEAQALSTNLEEKHLLAGEVLFCQGDPGEAFYVVSSGKLCVHHPDDLPSGLKYLDPGEFVGEMTLLHGQPHRATVTAVEDTRLLQLSKLAIDRLADETPILINRLVNVLLPRFQEVQVRSALTQVFGSLEEATLCDLQKKIEWRRIECGQVLCKQGEPGEEMYIVVQGRLRFAVDEAGEKHDLGEVGAGESVGECALLAESGTPDGLRSATVYATRLTDIIVIPRPVFENLMCQYPQTLLSLSRRVIRREMLIAQSALPKVSAQVIAVLPTRPDLELSEFVRRLADALSSLGSTLSFSPASFEQSYGKPGAAQTPLNHPTSLLINAWLDEHEREHQYAIYEALPSIDELGHLTPWAQRSVEDADIILLVGEGGADPSISAVEAALPSVKTRARMELVLLHPTGCQVPSGTVSWLEGRRSGEFPVQAHHHVRLGVPADFRRLARRLSGRPIALTLGGGGARGWAHIGVIRAIEEANLEVDWVGGASMGAIIAAAYALDLPVERLTELAVKFSDPKKLLDYTFPYASITSTRRITALLQEFCSGANIEDTWRPYFCVSANLTRGEEQVHSSGMLWKSVRASMAFPAVFAPVLEDGCVLIDGGAANNLPVDRMREMCPTGTVIGVDLLTSSPTSGPYDFGPSLSGWQALLGRLSPFAHTVKAPNLLDIIAGVVYSNNRYRLNEVWRSADLLIRVPVEAYGLLEFDKYAQIIDLGYGTAKEFLKDFKPS